MLTHELIKAEVVYNGLGTPRLGAVAVVQDDGDSRRLVGIERSGQARSLYPRSTERDAGFAVSPAPVNAHTHLDLSSMPYTPGPYPDFIRAVVRHQNQGLRGLAAAERGVAELRASGTEAVGDIVTDAAVMEYLLTRSGLRGVAYWEVFAPDPGRADAVFDEVRGRIDAFRALERPEGMRVGLAPHTPHSVSGALLVKVAAWAKAEALPMQIHVAETPAEVTLHRDGTGPLATLLRDLGVPWSPSGLSPIAYLASLGVLDAAPALVHMVAVGEEDLVLVRKAGCPVVHCPRSNTALGSGRFPWEAYAKHGIDVAFGTDSRGSSPDLSVIHEVLAARALHGKKAAPQALVRAAVKGGHRVLGSTPPRVLRGDPADGLRLWSMYTA